MKNNGIAWMLLVAFLALPVAGWASEGARNYQINTRLRIEYDDNIYEEGEDETSSLKFTADVEFVVRFSLENTTVGLRYEPRFTWWEDREGDDTDLHHQFDAFLNHSFTPRVTLDLNNRFRFAERPEAVEDEVVVRSRGDFYFNSASGTLGYQFVPNNVVQVRGRYNLMRYDDDDVADRQDYDKVVVGTSLRHQLQPQIWISADFDLDTIDYKGPENDRGSDTMQFGGGVEYLLSPLSVFRLNAGYQYKEFDNDDFSSTSSPFFNTSVAWGVSPATRLTLGAEYSFSDADIFPYAGQDRTRVYAAVGHDVTAQLSVNVGASYVRSKYDADRAVRAELLELGVREELEDGTEELVRLTVDAAYRINRNNWLIADWNLSSLDSDLRSDFDRNRIGLGWRNRF